MLHRRRRPLLAGLAAITILLAATPSPLSAQGLGGLGAAGAMPAGGSDPYTVSGVQVDVTAANANAARDKAIVEAQRKAYEQLAQRVGAGGGSAPKLSDADLSALVQGFEIDDERASATRYIATITVQFRSTAVREGLGAAAATAVETSSKPLVVLPVTVVDGRAILWEERTPWAEVWEARDPASSTPQLIVPFGELDEVAAIGVAEALTGSPEAIRRIAAKHQAVGVVVVKAALPSSATAKPTELSVEITRWGLDGARGGEVVNVRADPDDRMGDLLRRGVTTAAVSIEQAWKKENAASSGAAQKLSLTVPINGLPDWLEVRRRLTGAPGLDSVEVAALSRREVSVVVGYRGDVERLRQALAQRDLDLAGPPYEVRLGARAPAGQMAPRSPTASASAPPAPPPAPAPQLLTPTPLGTLPAR